MPQSSSSSSAVSDALANLTKAATLAVCRSSAVSLLSVVAKGHVKSQLNAVQGAQDEAHTDITRALSERDDALHALHDAQLEAKDLENREEGWKAAVSRILSSAS